MPSRYSSCAGTTATTRYLAREFFERPPDDVAHDLVGVTLAVTTADGLLLARIVETEAYGGSDDPASHAFRGPTPRCAVMFGPAGHLYVYRSYGVHWCMNVVTEEPGTASAVLLRGAEIVTPRPLATGASPTATVLKGPGNLTRGLGVNGHDNGADCVGAPPGRFRFVASAADDGMAVECSARVGLSRARERTSRYFLEGHPAVSRHPRYASGSIGSV
jgi:DNA-3-methyladenine glycosylase